MTRFLTVLALLLAISGCVPTPYAPDTTLYYTPPQPVESATPDAYDPDFDATYGAAPDVSTDLIPGQTSVPDIAAPIQTAPEGPELDRQRAACVSDGGRLMPRGAGFFVCVHQTQDAGRQCDASADCEGVCLARSRTCAPMRPILGCQEVFTLPGRRETVCTE